MSTLLFGRELTKGEIGCALSHQSVYQRIGIQEEPYALVLEDDVTLIDGAKILKVLNQITEMVNFRKKPVCVQFGFQENSERNAVGSQITFQKLAKPHFGNYMYFLNKTAAKILEISKDQKIVTCADWPVAANRIDWWKINAPLINLRIDDSILNFERKGEVTKYDNWRKHNSRKQRINKFKHILYKFYTDPQFSSYSKSDLVGYLIPSKLYLMRRRSKFSIRV
jgi:glycosyl transferase family 25